MTSKPTSTGCGGTKHLLEKFETHSSDQYRVRHCPGCSDCLPAGMHDLDAGEGAYSAKEPEVEGKYTIESAVRDITAVGVCPAPKSAVKKILERLLAEAVVSRNNSEQN